MSERVIICGSRSFTGSQAGFLIGLAIDALPGDTTVIVGGARGVDTIAEHCARDQGLIVERHEADWQQHGKAAGPIRNQRMLNSGADRVIAFWDGASRGTRHMIKISKAAGIPVNVIATGTGDPDQ